MTDQFEKYQGSKMTAAEETSLRLSDRARKLLESGMVHDGQRPHKWATGREKWEAQQLAGAKAAGVRGRGRPRKVVDWVQELDNLMAMVKGYQDEVLAGHQPDSLEASVIKIKVVELERAGVLAAEVAMAVKMLVG